jgi:cytoskeleton protein RodZ
MERGSRPGEFQIGAALADARARAGLDVAEVERRTKIRAKYLRALEEEHWDELPSAAYAKGFLRTYAGVLDLDAELLVDEYRRQVEVRLDEKGRPLGEQVLEHRRRPGQEARRFTPGTAVLAVVAVVAVAVAVVAVAGDEEGSPQREPAGKAGGPKHREREQQPASPPSGELVRLELYVRKPVEVCLLGAEKQELIDGQLLSAGSRDAFASEHFQLRFPAGFDRDQIDLELNGERAKLPRVQGPARLEITPPSRVREASPPGESCP